MAGKKRLSDAELKKEMAKLVTAQAKVRDQISQQAAKSAAARTRQMGDADWRNYTKVTKYARDNAKLSATRQRQAAAVTNTYLARLLTLIEGTTAAPSRQVSVDELRGIPQESVYGRLADYYRYLRDNPDRQETAEDAGTLVVLRAEEIAEMDIHLATRAQAQKFMTSKSKIQYYRRVIHPELNESKVSCGLCIVASDRVYKKADLLPIHFHCKCEVVPVTDETRDYGQRLNQDDLNALYAAAGGTAAKKLKETRFSIRQHGELGPVLTYEGNRFRGPAEVADDTTHDKELPEDE